MTQWYSYIDVKRVIGIICSSNFTSFGPTGRILEPSQVGNLFIANPVFEGLAKNKFPTTEGLELRENCNVNFLS